MTKKKEKIKTDHSVLIAGNTLNDGLGLLVPEEDVAAVGAGDDELALRAVVVDALDGGVVAVALVAVDVVTGGRSHPVRVERINVLVVVAGQDLSAVVVVDGAGDVRPHRGIQLQQQQQSNVSQMSF